MDSYKTIKKFIQDNYLFDDSVELKNDVDLFEKGIIDSTGIIELVSFLEETYNIIVNDDELIPENFSTLDNINNYLTSVKKVNLAV